MGWSCAGRGEGHHTCHHGALCCPRRCNAEGLGRWAPTPKCQPGPTPAPCPVTAVLPGLCVPDTCVCVPRVCVHVPHACHTGLCMRVFTFKYVYLCTRTWACTCAHTCVTACSCVCMCPCTHTLCLCKWVSVRLGVWAGWGTDRCGGARRCPAGRARRSGSPGSATAPRAAPGGRRSRTWQRRHRHRAAQSWPQPLGHPLGCSAAPAPHPGTCR